VSLSHEAWNGWNTIQVATRCTEVAYRWAQELGLDSRRVPIVVDDAGVGGGVVDWLVTEGWNAFGLNAACRVESLENDYPNWRSALWFGLADEAGRGNVSFARLPEAVRSDLRRELLAPTYRLDTRGRRVVETKDETKERLGRSPDNADGLNLAYAAVGQLSDRVAGQVLVP
jgi:hypothetical protein